MQPIISICIPTYNRENCLNNLLENIFKIKKMYGNSVEICISNNQSTDNTNKIIATWREKMPLKENTQSTNIGAAKNLIEVTRLATGKWILIIGDDDELVAKGFDSLLDLLSSVDENEWILAGVANQSGIEHLLGEIKPGLYEANRFRRIILRTGLYRYGFIGMHIFPAKFRTKLFSMSVQETQSWPHIALFMRHVIEGRVRVFTNTVVKQCAGGNELYWNPGDWVKINLGKINLIAETRSVIGKFNWFFDLLILREMYSLGRVKDLICWRLFEENNFKNEVINLYKPRYLLLGPFSIFLSMHLFFILLIFVVPSFLLSMALSLIGKRHILEDYRNFKEKFAIYDGVKRGL